MEKARNWAGMWQTRVGQFLFVKSLLPDQPAASNADAEVDTNQQIGGADAAVDGAEREAEVDTNQ